MPAKNLSRINEDGIYLHLYNKGIEKRAIFNDEVDYRTFLDYLKDYLTPPKDPSSLKKDFIVHGHTFQGTPHLLKNYFNNIELVAYSLLPDHFHLILHQITKGSIENFIRSLCTRYSIYYNKKYQHTGALFAGPYKSVPVEIGLRLTHLSRYLHQSGNHSSYPEYLNLRKTEWIKPEVILNLFNKTNTTYKDFVEKDRSDEGLLLEKTTLDNKSEHPESILERRILTRDGDLGTNPNSKPGSRVPDFLAISATVFLLLVTFGVGNIKLSTAKNLQSFSATIPSETTPAVLAEIKDVNKTPANAVKSETLPEKALEATPEAAPKTILIVKIADNSSSVNIRQKPTISSEKIGEAKDGNTFEYVSLHSEWYEVKLPDGSFGFISEKYIEKYIENK